MSIIGELSLAPAPPPPTATEFRPLEGAVYRISMAWVAEREAAAATREAEEAAAREAKREADRAARARWNALCEGRQKLWEGSLHHEIGADRFNLVERASWEQITGDTDREDYRRIFRATIDGIEQYRTYLGGAYLYAWAQLPPLDPTHFTSHAGDPHRGIPGVVAVVDHVPRPVLTHPSALRASEIESLQA